MSQATYNLFLESVDYEEKMAEIKGWSFSYSSQPKTYRIEIRSTSGKILGEYRTLAWDTSGDTAGRGFLTLKQGSIGDILSEKEFQIAYTFPDSRYVDIIHTCRNPEPVSRGREKNFIAFRFSVEEFDENHLQLLGQI
jgi:hypothetical protein